MSPFSSQFWLDEVTKLSQSFKVLRGQFHKRVIYLKVHFTFGFQLSINIGICNSNVNLFHPFLGWWRHQGKSKLQTFEIVVLKTNASPQISLYYFLRYITLNFFERTVENDAVIVPRKITPVTKILKRLSIFSVLKQVVLICINFHKTWLKTWLDINIKGCCISN